MAKGFTNQVRAINFTKGEMLGHKEVVVLVSFHRIISLLLGIHAVLGITMNTIIRICPVIRPDSHIVGQNTTAILCIDNQHGHSGKSTLALGNGASAEAIGQDMADHGFGTAAIGFAFHAKYNGIPMGSAIREETADFLPVCF